MLSLASLAALMYILMIVFHSYGVVDDILTSWLIVMLPISILFIILAFDGLRNEDFKYV